MPSDRPGTDAPDRDASTAPAATDGGRPNGPKRPPRPPRAGSGAGTSATDTRPARTKKKRSKPADAGARRTAPDSNGTSPAPATPVTGAGTTAAAPAGPPADDVRAAPAAPATVPPAQGRGETGAGVDPTTEVPFPTVAGASAHAGAVEAAPTEATGRSARRARKERATAAPTGRRRGRRVHRVVRRVELWSVLKLALVLYTCLYAAVLGTLAVLWGLAYSSGQIENLQEFLADVGLENYRFYGDQMFRAAAAIGAIGVLAATTVTVLTAGLVNVISEATGGIRLVVIEEDASPRS